MPKTHLTPAGGNKYVDPYYHEFGITGNVWYVGSTVTGASDASGYGTSPDAPFVTLAYAVGQVTATNGDTIYLLPGHAESLSGAAAVSVTKAGVSVIGLGRGTARPAITWHTTDATFKVTGANFLLRNVLTLVDIDEVVSMFDIRAAFCTLDAVDFRETASAQAIQFLLTTSAANDLVIENCMHFQDNASASNAKWIQIVGGNRQVIRNSTLQITTTSNSASNIIAVTTAATDILIQDVRIVQLGGTATVPVSLVANTSGMLINVFVASAKTAIAGSIAAASCYCFNTQGAHVVNKTGIAEPVADA